jgi:hypothetical protein
MALDRDTDTAADRHVRGTTPAQWYGVFAGTALLLAGIFGFLAEASFDTAQRDSFLGFEVNGWHNAVHLLSGLVLLAAARTRPSARAAAIGFGVVYGLVAVIGLIDGSDVLGVIPVDPADNILHIALAMLGIVSGLMSPGHPAEPPPGYAGTLRAQTSTGRFNREPVDTDEQARARAGVRDLDD